MPSFAFLAISSKMESELAGEGDPAHTLVQKSEERKEGTKKMPNMARSHRMNIRNQIWIEAKADKLMTLRLELKGLGDKHLNAHLLR